MSVTSSSATSHLVLRAELAQLSRLSRWVEDFAQRLKLPQNLSFAIELCTEEAVANIIMYSGAADSGEEITVELVNDGGDVLAIIEDGGRPFDPTAAPPRRRPTSIEDAPIGKLGIHLMRSYASQMRYEWRDGRNRLTLMFTLAEAAAKAPA